MTDEPIGTPRISDYGRLIAQAEGDRRRSVVGALIVDQRGRVFVHRRAPNRAFLPDRWDIVGGHLEPGETLLEALRREVAEETGWQVRGDPQLIHVADWVIAEGDASGDRREFDFLVDVDGDLAQPRLEWPHHTESRWIGPDDLELLAENRGQDGGMVRRLVELALGYARRQGRHGLPHATVFVDARVSSPIERVRMEWDPAMAAQIPAHVSIAYPDETDGIDALVRDVGRAAARTRPFRLRLGRVRHRGRPEDGVFIEVDDIDGGWARLRSAVVQRPVETDIAPHLTLVHPRTTNRGPQAWGALATRLFGAEFVVTEVAITAFDGRAWPVIARLPLRRLSRPMGRRRL